jgi:hypothetical protein
VLTYPSLARPSRRTISLALPLTLVIAACGAAAAPSPTPGGETPRATPTAVPGVGGQPGGGGGSGGNTGTGIDPGLPGGGILVPEPPVAQDPLLGDASVVVAVPGRVNPQQVNVQLVRAALDGAGVVVELRWYSGVAPCYVLDSVGVDRDDEAKMVRLTVMEGSNPGNSVCIDLAELKATVVDLGELSAGSWTISAEGDAKAITIEVG